ncbi:MAG TPA: glycosyltransferase family 4 protein [Solirubrobacterales bacterium]|jgi:glycosyltransferase involved in cell wall biosynthesis|nr:glycosyltransferase family 4 protein [Solirubrobacterales bacterium]
MAIPAMRILVLSNLFPPAVLGGYEVECAGVVERLRRDHEVLVLTSRRERHGAPPEEEGVVRELPFLPYRRLNRLLTPFQALSAAKAARRALRDFRPDLVYVWNGSQIPQVAIRILERSGAAVAYRVCEHWFGELYDSDAFMRGLSGGPWRWIMQATNAAPSLRVDPSTVVDAAVSWNSETLRRLTPVPATVRPVLERTIFPATERSEVFAATARRAGPDLTIGFAGRIGPHKGVDIALRAVAELRDRHALDVHLDLAGSGDAAYVRELEGLAAELGIEPAVDFLGELTPDELAGLFSTLRAIVVPSVWQEPAGLVLIEAALGRVPVIASSVGGIPEILHDGEHALLCPPGDSAALADAIARTLAEPAETEARVTRAFDRVQAFRAERYYEAMDEFLASAREALAR